MEAIDYINNYLEEAIIFFPKLRFRLINNKSENYIYILVDSKKTDTPISVHLQNRLRQLFMDLYELYPEIVPVILSGEVNIAKVSKDNKINKQIIGKDYEL